MLLKKTFTVLYCESQNGWNSVQSPAQKQCWHWIQAKLLGTVCSNNTAIVLREKFLWSLYLNLCSFFGLHLPTWSVCSIPVLRPLWNSHFHFLTGHPWLVPNCHLPLHSYFCWSPCPGELQFSASASAFDRCWNLQLLKNKDFLLLAQSLVSFGSESIIQRKLNVVPRAPDVLSYPYAVLGGEGKSLLPAEPWEISSLMLWGKKINIQKLRLLSDLRAFTYLGRFHENGKWTPELGNTRAFKK